MHAKEATVLLRDPGTWLYLVPANVEIGLRREEGILALLLQLFLQSADALLPFFVLPQSRQRLLRRLSIDKCARGRIKESEKERDETFSEEKTMKAWRSFQKGLTS